MEEKSSVKKLIEAADEILGQYAKNLQLIVKGKGDEISIPIEDEVVDRALKIVKEVSNLEAFNKIANADKIADDNKEKMSVKGNPFEERSKVVKDKLEGKS